MSFQTWPKIQKLKKEEISKVKTLALKHKQQNKKNKLDFIKIKTFCALKDFTKTMERQTHKLEKTFANCISSKELVLTIYVELLQLDNKKANN